MPELTKIIHQDYGYMKMYEYIFGLENLINVVKIKII